MNPTIYSTLMIALEEAQKKIHDENHYFVKNPDEAVYDLNADFRKQKLEESYEAERWLKDFYRNHKAEVRS